MKLKAIVTGLVIAGVLTTQAYAASVAQSGATFSNSDIQSLFVDNQQPLQLAPLSAQEMQATRGGASLQNVTLANAIGGGVVGSYGGASAYLGHYLGSPGETFSTYKLVQYMGAGAATGALGGIILPNNLLAVATWNNASAMGFVGGLLGTRID